MTHPIKVSVILIFWGYCACAQTGGSSLFMKTIDKAESLSFQNIDSALYYGNEALQMGQKMDSTRWVFQAYRTLGLINEDNNRLLEAKYAYGQALRLAESVLPVNDQLMIYTDWAIIHKKLGQYVIAEEYHRLTIARATEIGNWEMVEEGYHGLGTMYSMMSDFDAAIAVYLKSIEAAEKWGNKAGVVLTQQNISNVYCKSKKYKLALDNIAIAYQLALPLGDSIRIASILSVYGNIESANGSLDSALVKHLAALAIFTKVEDKARMSESLSAVADVYFQQKNYWKAEDYFNLCARYIQYMPAYGKANFFEQLSAFYKTSNRIKEALAAVDTSLSICHTFGFKEVAIQDYLRKSQIYKDQEKFAFAYLNLDSAYQLNLGLNKEAKQQELAAEQFRLDIKKRDIQIENQSKQIASSRLVKYLLIGGLLLLSTLLFYSWKQMQAKRAATARVELLMKELHHRVKNNFQIISSIMRLQARQTTNPDLSKALGESRSRLEAIAMIHQQFYQSENIEVINFYQFLTNLIEKLTFTYQIHGKPFDLKLSVQNHYLHSDIALPLGLIINELLTNFFKYAYSSVDSPCLSLSVSDQCLKYSDNGNSLSPSFDIEKSNSFGIQIIRSLTEQLKGKYRFYYENGLSFETSFS